MPTGSLHSLVNWDDPINMIRYSETLSDPTSPDKQSALTNLLADDQDTHPEIEYYYTQGSWRDSTKPTPDKLEETLDKYHVNQCKPQQCYYNAQTNLTPDATYVEGFLLESTNPATATVVPHAWLEINSKVIELTPNLNQSETHYFGCEFKNETVHQILAEREYCSPVIEGIV